MYLQGTEKNFSMTIRDEAGIQSHLVLYRLKDTDAKECDLRLYHR